MASPFGRYLLHEKIGQGGMGTVFRAEDPSLRRVVALKLLAAGLEEDALRRFEREARIVATLRHPNIVSLHDFGHVDGQHFFTMDYIDGRCLGDRALQPRRAAEVVRDAAKAVHYAHQRGLLHRDLKPANLMLDSGGRAYVLDFGLAKSTLAPSSISSTGLTIGTPAFMSPEQARGVEDLDARADVYGLGATLHALLAGRPPFDGASPPEIIANVLDRRPDRLTAPPDLEAIALKAMDKERSRRYATAAEMAEDLTRFLADEPVRARPASVLQLVRRQIVRRKPVAAALAVSALTVAAVIAWFAARSAELDLRAEIRSLESVVLEARSASYVPGDDIFNALKRVHEALRRLEAISAGPAGARADVWIALGVGRWLVEDVDGAEQALLRADAIAPSGLVNLTLGRVYDRRAMMEVVEKGIRSERARRWSEQAIDRLDRAASGWEGADDLDRLIAQAYRARSAGKYEELARLCRHGLRQFPDAVRTEEFCFLLSTALLDSAQRLDFADRAVKRRPHWLPGLLQRALAYEHVARYEEALRDMDAAVRLHPRRAATHNHRGMVRWKAGDPQGAVADYDEAIRLDPRDATAWSNRGAAKKELGDLAGARMDTDEALRIDPDCVAALNNRGVLRSRSGDPAGALADCEKAIALQPSYARAYVNRARIRRERGDLPGALDDCDRAIGLDSQLVQAWSNRAAIRCDAGDLAGARADAEEALRLNPRDADAWYARGFLRMRADPDGALQDFAEAIKRDRGHARTYEKRAEIHYARGDWDAAIADMDALIRLRPKQARAWMSRGAARSMKGDRRGGRDDYDEAIRLDPDDAELWIGRGMTREKERDDDGAIEDFTECIRLKPDHARAYFHRATVRALRGENAAAISDYTSAIHIDPKYADAYANRAAVRLATGDRAGAAADLRKALEVAPPGWPPRERVERDLRRIESPPKRRLQPP